MRYWWLVFCLPALVMAKSPVWEVTSPDGHTAYLAATMHVLKPADYPLPESFEYAYNQATALVVETDLYAMQDDEFKQKLEQEGFYPQDKTLKSVLDDKAYAALAGYAGKRGLALADMQHMKVGLLLANITLHELGRLGVSATGVDMHYLQRAMIDKKPIYSLETLDEQIDYVVNMGRGHESELVLQSLADMQRMAEQLADMRKAWHEGDLKKLDALLNRDMKDTYPVLYQTLVVERNERWLPALASELQKPRVTLVLVGAGHLPGKKGLVSQLEKAGFKFRQLQ